MLIEWGDLPASSFRVSRGDASRRQQAVTEQAVVRRMEGPPSAELPDTRGKFIAKFTSAVMGRATNAPKGPGKGAALVAAGFFDNPPKCCLLPQSHPNPF